MGSNSEIVKKCYESFGKGDIPAVVGILADDIAWTDPGAPDIPYGGNCKGKPQVAEFFKNMAQACEYTRFEPQRYMESGDQVVALGFFEGKARATGKMFQSDWAMVWTFKNGLVKSFQAYFDTHTIAKAYKN